MPRLICVLLLLMAPLAAIAQTPFTNPIALPGTFEAENFDNGGEGVAYHDNVVGNAGGVYRTNEDVDIRASKDPAGGGYVIYNFESGEWLVYTVDIAAAGQYEIALRVASGTFTGAFHIEIDGANVTGTVVVPPTGNFDTFQWVIKKGVSLPAGQHLLKLVSEQQYFDVNQIRLTATPTTPFAGVIAIPGTFEAENFDIGGEGLAYHDNVAGNAGNVYRINEDVDIRGSNDPAGGGHVVYNFQTSEWLVYTVEVATSGLYDLDLRVASGTFTSSAFHVEIDGADVSGSVVVPATGSFDTFQWVSKKGVPLTAGRHVLKLVSEQQYFDVNQIRFTKVLHSPFHSTPIALPGAFEAEDFDIGGEGLAYHDNVAGNAGGLYRTNEDVDIRASKDTAGGGYVIYNFETLEWVLYTVDIAPAGLYDIELRLASGTFTNGTFHIEIDGVDVTGSVAVPATGSFDTFQWVGKKGVQLPAGQHVLKLVADQQYFDVNQIRVIASTAPRENPPGLLFRSGYEGVTEGAPRDCDRTKCRQDILGTDSETGFTWPPNLFGGNNRFDLRIGSDLDPNASTIGNYMFNEIRTGEGRNGSRGLYSEVRLNDSGQYNSYMFYPNTEVPELYVSYWAKLQPNLREKMSPPTFRVLFEWKVTNDERRLTLNIRSRVDGSLIWMIMLDERNTAEKEAIWRFDLTDASDPQVPVGEWFKVQIYWRRTGGTDGGRVWMAINERQLVDQRGSTMGPQNAPINRIFLKQLYTGSALPAYQWIDDLQIWTGFPTASLGDPWYDPPYAPH